MAYDPQANRRRPKPGDSDPAPVDALLDDEAPTDDGSSADGSSHDGPNPEDPPPAPGVTPDPADPVPDVVLAGTGMAGIGAGVVLLLVLRWLWKRSRRIAGIETAPD